MPLPQHIRRPADLITSPEATSNGFLQQALAKVRKANPYLAEATSLKQAIESAQSIEELVERKELRDELCAAAGFSDKALKHLSDSSLDNALATALQTIAKHAPDDWKEKLVHRFLLTCGDSLGGSMRNLTGALAGKQFNAAVISELKSPVRFSVEKSKSGKVQIIEWKDRFLVFDKSPDFISNSVDVILLKKSNADYRKVIESPNDFLACGELKGGIDPAGADEHWKTANSALRRLRRRFAELKLPLKTFFVGAAIEEAMSEEIFSQLQDGTLSYAANSTVPKQLASVARWLVSI